MVLNSKVDHQLRNLFKYIIISILICIPILCSAQWKKNNEKEISRLEQLTVTARLAGDTGLLYKMWAPEILLTTPMNNIVEGKPAVIRNQHNNNINYKSFERIVEEVQVHKKVVVTMGYEEFILLEDHADFKAGEPVRRRFTNVWMKQKGKWLQVARHASFIVSNF